MLLFSRCWKLFFYFKQVVYCLKISSSVLQTLDSARRERRRGTTRSYINMANTSRASTTSMALSPGGRPVVQHQADVDVDDEAGRGTTSSDAENWKRQLERRLDHLVNDLRMWNLQVQQENHDHTVGSSITTTTRGAVSLSTPPLDEVVSLPLPGPPPDTSSTSCAGRRNRWTIGRANICENPPPYQLSTTINKTTRGPTRASSPVVVVASSATTTVKRH